MEKKRVGGRFVSAGAELSSSSSEPVRSSQTRLIGRARRVLVEAVPEVALALAEKARTGSVPHVKLLLEMLGLNKGGFARREHRRKERTLEEILMEQWHKEP